MLLLQSLQIVFLEQQNKRKQDIENINHFSCVCFTASWTHEMHSKLRFDGIQ